MLILGASDFLILFFTVIKLCDEILESDTWMSVFNHFAVAELTVDAIIRKNPQKQFPVHYTKSL